MPTLRIYRSGDLLVEQRLREGSTSIGRADSCDLALPGDIVSRVHCVLMGQGGRWMLVDRSRHGTTVDGEPARGRVELRDGSTIGIGDFTLSFSLGGGPAAMTAPREPDRGHELMVAHDGESLAVERARLTVVSGPGAGEVFVLRAPRVSVGGRGSHLVIDNPALFAEHCFLRVARGRVMIEPGRGPVRLDGQRVRAITPIRPGEDFRMGETVLRVDREHLEETPEAGAFGELVGESEAMRRLFGTLRRMAGHHYTVLIIGESGTGKELIARGIHDHSGRSQRPFVALNCGAISPTLFESELFGHEKGAFTGADSRRAGAFQDADGGTLFLDEIGELPEDAQAKLLRVLETGEVRRVGSTKVEVPDVRVVAATNRDLAREVRLGRFREDLFFRLAVLSVHVPPLRDRMSDLPVLCSALCRTLGPQVHVTDAGLEQLRRHRWPGNVRELRNVLTRAYVLHGPRIGPEALSFHQLPAAVPPPPVPQSGDSERTYLVAMLDHHDGNRSAVARELGIARSTLLYKMRRFGLIPSPSTE
jgi:DNA-binding NtrC family response regulator